MIDPLWREEDDRWFEESYSAPPQPALVTLHFLRDALRRSRWLCVACALAGALLGATAVLLLPAPSSGTVSLLLAHDPDVDPALAMENDLSLMKTRAVADAVLDELDLELTSYDFLQTVTTVSSSSTILVVTVEGDADVPGATRAAVLADTYLDFRAAQMESQTTALTENYRDRVAALDDQVAELTRRYDLLVSAGPAGQSEATDLLTQRSRLIAEIGSMQQMIESASLESRATVAASHVLDPASELPTSTVRRLALGTASGVLGGAGVGIGLVLFVALTSNKVRRRADIAAALGVPVVASARARPRARVLPHPVWPPRTAVIGLTRALVEAIESQPRGRSRVAVVSVDVARITAELVIAVALELVRTDRKVMVVDLSTSARVRGQIKGRAGRIAVGREDETHLERVAVRAGPRPLRFLLHSPEVGLAEAWTPGSDPKPLGISVRALRDSADVVLSVVEADMTTGVGELATWADTAVVLVAAGKSSAERLRTTAAQVRAAGVVLHSALLVGADVTDESFGGPDPAEGENGVKGLDP